MWRPSVAQFLNALVIHLRGTKKTKNPTDVLAKHKAQIPAEGSKDRPEFKAKPKMKKKQEVTNRVRKTKAATKNRLKDYLREIQNSSRKVKYNFGKNKNNSIMKTALIIVQYR
jgi:hypothetical protein